jgi:hypothetical protein
MPNVTKRAFKLFWDSGLEIHTSQRPVVGRQPDYGKLKTISDLETWQELEKKIGGSIKWEAYDQLI